MNPLTTARNKYSQNRKNSSIFTPKGICNFLFNILRNYIDDCLYWDKVIIVDPAVGTGNLLRPFKVCYKDEITTIGYDIRNFMPRNYTDLFVQLDFLNIDSINESTVTFTIPPVDNFIAIYDSVSSASNKNVFTTKNISLVLCNPPFNNDTDSKYNKKLLPELFAKKIFELYGYDTPLVLFAPMGMRLNQRVKSKRYRWLRDCDAEITSIISLPLDIFPDVEFHNEIIIFNIPEGYLNPHYFLPEKYL